MSKTTIVTIKALILYKNNIQLSYLQICMIIFTQTEQALILYKNNIQQERKAKRKECIYTALILYKNNIQLKAQFLIT